MFACWLLLIEYCSIDITSKGGWGGGGRLEPMFTMQQKRGVLYSSSSKFKGAQNKLIYKNLHYCKQIIAKLYFYHAKRMHLQKCFLRGLNFVISTRNLTY
jgi:hypothetical protein